jgi:hypothetical protein
MTKPTRSSNTKDNAKESEKENRISPEPKAGAARVRVGSKKKYLPSLSSICLLANTPK